jgi:hypothetical protein
MGVDVGARGRTTVRAGASLIAVLNVVPIGEIWWDNWRLLPILLLAIDVTLVVVAFHLLRAIPQMRVTKMRVTVCCWRKRRRHGWHPAPHHLDAAHLALTQLASEGGVRQEEFVEATDI